VSEHHDPPGGDSDWLPRTSARARDSFEERANRLLGSGTDGASQSSGAIIPFEQFARRKSGGLDTQSMFSGVTGPLAGSMLPANYVGGQTTLRGTVNPMTGLEEPVEEQGEQHLIFSLESFECAFKAEHIQTVERVPEITAVPNVASWIDGVIHLRGQIISVVDLRSFLGLERQPSSARTRVVAGRIGDLVIGLVVDGVSEMRGILPNMIQLQQLTRSVPGWAASYVSGIASVGTRSVLLIDIERLLLSEKMHQYQSHGSHT